MLFEPYIPFHFPVISRFDFSIFLFRFVARLKMNQKKKKKEREKFIFIILRFYEAKYDFKRITTTQISTESFHYQKYIHTRNIVLLSFNSPQREQEQIKGNHFTVLVTFFVQFSGFFRKIYYRRKCIEIARFV